MKRLTAVLAAVLLLTATVGGPVAAAGGDSGVLSGPVDDAAGISSTNVPADVVKYSGRPSVFVDVSDGEVSALTTWASDFDDRQVVAIDNESNRALIAASPEDLGLSTLDRLTDSGLASRSYVQRIAWNRKIELDPVNGIANSSNYQKPTGASFIETVNRGATFGVDGQAWSGDTQQSTLGDARDAIGVDQTTANGSGVTVAVLDTGMNVNATNDPLFGDRIVAPYDAVNNETGADAVATDTNHGAWTAAAIGANASNDSYDGVAPAANIMPIKVLGEDGSGSIHTIAKGIDHAEANGADVISLSLGSARWSPVLAAEIKSALRGNVTAVVVAVGNSKQTATRRYISSPADVDGVISVAATNVSAASSAQPAYFSEVGPDNGLDGSRGQTAGEGPDVASPGMQITAPMTAADGARTNVTLSGTSMATPLVSGVVALTLDANPKIVNDTTATRDAVLESAQPIPSAGVTEVGNGMVDAPNATALNVEADDQASARDEKAIARDNANRAYSGSWWVRVAQNEGT